MWTTSCARALPGRDGHRGVIWGPGTNKVGQDRGRVGGVTSKAGWPGPLQWLSAHCHPDVMTEDVQEAEEHLIRALRCVSEPVRNCPLIAYDGHGDEADFAAAATLLEDVGHLEEDPALLVASPNPSSSVPSPGDPSPFQAPVYEADELPLPQDLELRDSSVAPCSLGVWACRHLDTGKSFGPYASQQRPRLRESGQDWEVGERSPVTTVW
ncbi:MDS1 and EVI1 complex locus protein MDS1-like [Scleropages formosus]|uniref:MDS1 and EVI1 complex locus protein MDS1-like n=1 Tax=Scleropages formosus TaxID=113540 RepID=A0A0P7ULL7_SCLFO|nr:MDS1 and EVI1 complex locus protein MDS1-like [Scleropages formosus]